MTTRAEHLAWAKERAKQYLDRGDMMRAMTSIMSDLSKHPDTATNDYAADTVNIAISGNMTKARAFIDGIV